MCTFDHKLGANFDVCLGVPWCSLGHELGENSESSYTNHDFDDFVLDGSLSSGIVANVLLMCC